MITKAGAKWMEMAAKLYPDALRRILSSGLGKSEADIARGLNKGSANIAQRYGLTFANIPGGAKANIWDARGTVGSGRLYTENARDFSSPQVPISRGLFKRIPPSPTSGAEKETLSALARRHEVNEAVRVARNAMRVNRHRGKFEKLKFNESEARIDAYARDSVKRNPELKSEILSQSEEWKAQARESISNASDSDLANFFIRNPGRILARKISGSGAYQVGHYDAHVPLQDRKLLDRYYHKWNKGYQALAEMRAPESKFMDSVSGYDTSSPKPFNKKMRAII